MITYHLLYMNKKVKIPEARVSKVYMYLNYLRIETARARARARERKDSYLTYAYYSSLHFLLNK